MVLRIMIITAAALACACDANGHEVRPGYLELVETAPDEHAVTWKQPVLGDRRLKIDPAFPAACEAGPERAELTGGALIRRFTLTCPLRGETVAIAGLNRTLTDVFVRHTSANGDLQTAILRPGAASMVIGDPSGPGVGAYVRIGVDHIIFGWDHLLFVIGLVLLVRPRQLIGAATAFTLAHSVTLALSTLGGVSLPSAPVEIAIALSLALMGVEILHKRAGRPGLAARYPWSVAGLIGLVHGFGFAGALAEIGLPDGARALALLFFNIGVELGQLALIAALLGLGWLLARAMDNAPDLARVAGAYLVGIAGTFWAIERAAGLVTGG